MMYMQYRGYRAVKIGIELLKFINKVITIQKTFIPPAQAELQINLTLL